MKSRSKSNKGNDKIIKYDEWRDDGDILETLKFACL